MADLTIKIPMLPVSLNKAYATNFRTKRRFKTKDYMNFESVCGLIAPKRHNIKPGSMLSVNINLYGNWFTKSGSIRKVDAANFEKTLIDSIFTHLKLNDENIFELTIMKIQGDEETHLYIKEID